MLTTSIANSSKHSSNRLSGLKKTLIGITLSIAYLNPIAVLAQNNYDIQQLEQQEADYKLERNSLSTEMVKYMMLNPKASAALMAAGGGVAAIALENLTGGQRTVIIGLGLIGANHCRQSVNIQKCAEVATNVGSYVSQINNYDEQINLLTKQINSSQSYSANDTPDYSSSSSWTPGTPHPEFVNVVAGETEGKWIPAPGYRWINAEDKNNWNVIPKVAIGIGIDFKIEEQYDTPLIVKVYSDSPAEIIGLHNGMYITKVDGIPTQGKTLNRVAEILKGEQGSSVLIEYYDPENGISNTVQIVRDEFRT